MRNLREEAKDLIKEAYGNSEMTDEIIKALERKPYEKFESTKDHIYKLAGDYKCWDNRLTQDEALELCHILEKQETCEDCISRQAVDDAIYDYSRACDVDYAQIMEYIDKLPPVTPTQDTRQVARWVNNIHDLPICSKCGNYAVFDHAIDDYYYSDYCPKCGAKMENAVLKIYKEGEE